MQKNDRARLSAVRVAGSFSAAVLAVSPAAAQRRGGAPQSEGLSFRFMGPAIGNRIASAVSIPGDPTTYYAGAASGGIWKSTDSGRSLRPDLRLQPVQAIGALALADSDHKTYGRAPAKPGPFAIRHDGQRRLQVHRRRPDLDPHGPHRDRPHRADRHPSHQPEYRLRLRRRTPHRAAAGARRLQNEGWRKELGARPVCRSEYRLLRPPMDANDPNTLIAGTWEVVMHSWGMFSGGPGSGVFVTHDGGDKWKRVEGRGMPKSPVGKIDVAIAPENSKRIYALIQTADQGSVWRSDDGGENWAVVNWQRALIGRAGYYIRLAVHRRRIPTKCWWRTAASGCRRTAAGLPRRQLGRRRHARYLDGSRRQAHRVTHDARMNITADHGQTVNRVTLPIGQMYHVAVDRDVPYRIYGNMQDDGTMRGRTTTPEQGPNVPGQRRWRSRRRGGGGSRGSTGSGGCESGFTLPDPTDTISSGRRATGTRSPATTRGRRWRALSVRGCTRSIRSRTRPSIAATGRRRSPSTRSTTTPSITAAR